MAFYMVSEASKRRSQFVQLSFCRRSTKTWKNKYEAELKCALDASKDNRDVSTKHLPFNQFLGLPTMKGSARLPDFFFTQQLLVYYGIPDVPVKMVAAYQYLREGQNVDKECADVQHCM